MASDYTMVPGTRPPGPDCSDRYVTGVPSTLYSYIGKINYGTQKRTISGSCPIRYHANAKFDNLLVTGLCRASRFQGVINIQGWKHFDIKHPTKEGYRLRHSCIEGPENAIFYRGKLVDSNMIQLPDYWRGFVDPETITVNLTPHGIFQELYVKSIDWGTQITIANNLGGPINCSYVVCGERTDGHKLIVEYEGKSSDDYPGVYPEEEID